MSSEEPAPRLSRDEIAEAIRSLSTANQVRLIKVARRYARPSIGPEDLLQEAFLRVLDGRTCPRHVDVVRFLAEVMRSVAHGEQEKAAVRPVLVSAESEDTGERTMIAPDPSLRAEERMIAEQDVAGVLSLFDDDPAAQVIVEGRMEGMTADELRELTGLDRTGYGSKLKLIRRRIDRRYPQGWES